MNWRAHVIACWPAWRICPTDEMGWRLMMALSPAMTHRRWSWALPLKLPQSDVAATVGQKCPTAPSSAARADTKLNNHEVLVTEREHNLTQIFGV